MNKRSLFYAIKDKTKVKYLKEKFYKTEFGDIQYYIDMSAGSELTLVFLQG